MKNSPSQRTGYWVEEASYRAKHHEVVHFHLSRSPHGNGESAVIIVVSRSPFLPSFHDIFSVSMAFIPFNRFRLSSRSY